MKNRSPLFMRAPAVFASFKFNRCKYILWFSIILNTLYSGVFHLFHAFQNVFEKNATNLRLFQQT